MKVFPKAVFVSQNAGDSFKAVDVQTGFNFESQVFILKDGFARSFCEKVDLHVPESPVIVKVFDPVKAKMLHDRNNDCFIPVSEVGLDQYRDEKRVYELLKNPKFNSVYLKNQPPIFGWFIVKGYYHAMGPTIVLKYIDDKLEEFPERNLKYFSMAKKQLPMIHAKGIAHNNISKRNIICTKDRVYLVGFGVACLDSDRCERGGDNYDLAVAFGFEPKEEVVVSSAR